VRNYNDYIIVFEIPKFKIIKNAIIILELENIFLIIIILIGKVKITLQFNKGVLQLKSFLT